MSVACYQNAYAYFSITVVQDEDYGDEDQDPETVPGLELAHMHPGSMAEVLLRRVCPSVQTRAAYRRKQDTQIHDVDDAATIPETKAHEHELHEHAHDELKQRGEPLAVPVAGGDDRLGHEALADGHDAVAEAEAAAEEARVAIALAHSTSLSGEPELEVISEVAEPANSVAAHASESDSEEEDDDSDDDDDEDSDDDDDSEEDDSDSDDEHDESLKSIPSFFNHQPPRRSPLSQTSEGEFQRVYKGYHCTIRGCDFAASTAEHVRHHIRSASHWYLLDTGAD